jgi:DNA topoisomerase-2
VITIIFLQGLGTNTSEEARTYFKSLEKYKQIFLWTENSAEAIDTTFNADRIADRKLWLTKSYHPLDHSDYNQSHITIDDYINREMIQYSHESNMRALPCVIDGLKRSQRKILHTCFKKNYHNEIKLVQLGGSVLELTGYHHGEASLQKSIVKMAQDFVGSNNIPLLEPCGQFGTRHCGGKDFASARYISTKLSILTRYIYPAVDDSILEYVEEDGLVVEPKHYLPIIPMILINPIEGIGTGWSSQIPPFNPIDVCDYISMKLRYASLEVLLIL